jgi:hypothetical protein
VLVDGLHRRGGRRLIGDVAGEGQRLDATTFEVTTCSLQSFAISGADSDPGAPAAQLAGKLES